jgi:hypothetical protein
MLDNWWLILAQCEQLRAMPLVMIFPK